MNDRKRKILFLLWIAGLLLLFPIEARAQGGLDFHENFDGGTLNLNWRPFPGFSEDSLTPILDPDTPQADMWAGRLTNQQLGGFAALSYAGMADMDDYVIEAWVYTLAVTSGRAPLNGIAVRVDPRQSRFYRFATHFDSEQRVTFAYVGRDTNNYPVYLHSWTATEIPGGLPSSSGWHKMGVKCSGNRFWVYWDGLELPGCPLEDGRIEKGFFGVYANYVGGEGIIETRVDAIKVTENPIEQNARFSFPLQK